MTRDEAPDGPLSAALRAYGFEPVPCPVLLEAAAVDRAAVQRVADTLESFEWLIASSARAVHWLSAVRGSAWPRQLQTAAVGPATAQALREHGVGGDVVVGHGDGAEALWSVLAEAVSWPGQRVLVLTTPGGRSVIQDGLRARGAEVTALEAYRMEPRPAAHIAADWRAAGADAVVVASSRVAETLADAVGAETLAACRVVAIGSTTSATLTALGVAHETPPRASFLDVARLLGTEPWPESTS